MMLVTVWVFIGIEGASVYSQRAAAEKTSAVRPCWASPACSRSCSW